MKKIGPYRTVAGGNRLHRLVQCLGDLPQGRGPVAAGLLGQLRGAGDDGDGVGERRLDQEGGLSVTHLGWGSFGPRWIEMVANIRWFSLGIRQVYTARIYFYVQS